MTASAAPFEPRIARVAALLADPARSRMLAYLMDGQFASAGELAQAASVTAATASGHLARLLQAKLLICEPRGRHRYYRLADSEVAHALEALALVAERSSHESAWTHPSRQRLRQARCCYGHLAGDLGVRLFDALRAAGALQDGPGGLALTPAGHDWLARLGMAAPESTGKRRFAYPCLDWSERRDHLAGQLADALLAHCLAQDWLRRGTDRALVLTAAGQRHLLPLLATDRSVPEPAR